MPDSKIKKIFSGSFPIKPIEQPYVIAEIGVNHEGEMSVAKHMIDEAKEGGADAVKFQTYRASTLASINSPAYWNTDKEKTSSQYELFKKYEGFWREEMIELKSYCDQVNIGFMSTPFDIESATFLNDLMEVFKISSSDITNKPFIEHICSYGKPVILSTGASELYEIQQAVSWIKPYRNPLALLHCVLNYPTDEVSANLGMITDLKRQFPDYIIGYSDHVPPGDMRVCEVAMLLGCVIIEKHFTYDKSLSGNDHYHAMDKADLINFRNNSTRILNMLGSFSVSALESETLARKNARRSLVASRPIEKGTKITIKDITFKRPAHGVSPKYIDEIVGKHAREAIKEDTVLQWNMFDD